MAGDVRRAGDFSETKLESLLTEIRDYTRASGDSYYLVRTLCNLGSSLAEAGFAKRAIEMAEEALRWEPQNPYAWNLATRSNQIAGQLRKATAMGYEAVDRHPDDAIVRGHLAMALRVAGRLGEAEVVYRRALDLEPENTINLGGLANVLKNKGEFDEAEAVYRRALDLEPEDTVRLGGLADVLKNKGEFDEAEVLYRRALDLEPEDTISLGGLVNVLKKKGEFDEAEVLYRRVLDLEPENTINLGGMADVLKNKDEMDDSSSFDHRMSEEATDGPHGTGSLDRPASDLTLMSEPLGTTEPGGVATDENQTSSHTMPPIAGADETALERELRSEFRRAILTDGSQQHGLLLKIIEATNQLLDRAGLNIVALYTKLEALSAADLYSECWSLFDSLPDYIQALPEFQATIGQMQVSESIKNDDSTYDPQTLGAIRETFAGASRSALELKPLGALAPLRASAAMMDGHALDNERLRDLKIFVDLVSTQSPDRVSRSAELSRWWTENAQQTIGLDEGSTELDLRDIVANLVNGKRSLDLLSEELISASRYAYNP